MAQLLIFGGVRSTDFTMIDLDGIATSSVVQLRHYGFLTMPLDYGSRLRLRSVSPFSVRFDEAV